MKIGIFDPYLDTKGGGERYMLTLAECLSLSHQVNILWNNKNDVEDAGNRFNLDMSRISVVPNKVFSSKSSLVEKFNSSRKYDLLICLSDGSIPIPFFTRTLLHFQFPIEWVQPSIVDSLKIRAINKIICNSQFTKKFIDKKLHVNSDVLYPPVDVQFFLDNTERKDKTIVSVGRYQSMDDGSDFKRIEFMLTVFSEMVDTGLEGWKFVIATSYLPVEKEKIRALEKKYSSYPVEIIHNANAIELKKLYGKAKIYWHAAGYDINTAKYPERAEHFGITTVEAMASGCIPLVYNAGGQKEIIEDGKNGYVWMTKKELMDKTSMIIKKDRELDVIIHSAKETCKQYSKEKFSAHIQSIVNNL